MSTETTRVDELRSTLDAHARTVVDPDALARTVAVRERVRVVRRRRAATAVAAAVAVLAGGVGVATTVVDRTDEVVLPAGPPAEVAGQRIPDRVVVTGNEYTYVEAVPLDLSSGAAEHVLRPGNGYRAVALVGAGLGEGWATLQQFRDDAARVLGEDTVTAPVPMGEGRTDLRVVAHDLPEDAEVALAVFERTALGGVVEDEGRAYFREGVDDGVLERAEFGEPGQGEVRFTVRGSLDTLFFSDFCTTEAQGLWVKLSIDGEGWTGTDCGASEGVADAGASWSSFSTDGEPVEEHDVRLYVTEGSKGREVVSDPTTVIGVGVYDRDEPREEVLGVGYAQEVDSGGRRWLLEEVRELEAGTPVSLPADDRARLLGLASRGSRTSLAWVGEVSGRTLGTSHIAARGSLSIDGLLLPGEDWTVRPRLVDGARAALLVYRPVT